jgi:SAM-dependent methyltransferase
MDCRVCGNERAGEIRKLRSATGERRVRLVFCPGCLSLFSDAPESHSESKFKEHLGWHIKTEKKSALRADIIMRDLTKMLPGAETHLDIGAGIGTTMLAAARYGLNSSGVEPNTYAVRSAKERGVEIHNGYFPSDAVTGKFDLITIVHVLEHLSEPLTFLRQAAGRLNKRGLIYISVPYFSVFNHFHYILFPGLAGTPFTDPEEHITCFSVKGMISLADKAGLALAGKKLKASWGWWSGGLVFERKS